jgi:hypothetical protein
MRSNTATPYSFSDGMGFAQSKAYISKGGPGRSLESHFDVGASIERDAEARFLKNAREKEAESKISTQLFMNRLTRPKEKTTQSKSASSKPSVPKSKEKITPNHVTQTTSDFQKPEGQRHSYGSRLVQDALKELKKSTASLCSGDNTKQTDIDKRKINPTLGHESGQKKELSGTKLDKVSKRM